VPTRVAIVAVCVVSVMLADCGGNSPSPQPSPIPSVSPTPGPAPPAITTADAVLARCPTRDEVAKIDADLVLTFENDATAPTCSAVQSGRDLTLLQAQVYRTLIIAGQLSFDAPLPWTANALYGWLTSAIAGIRFRGDIDTSFCCSPNRTINVQTRNLTALQFPSDFRWVGTLLVLFVHEARHSEGYPHACDGVRDNSIGELGAWSVQYHLNLFLAARSGSSYISSAARGAFTQDARNVCTSRFCKDSCPT
jgi:hypothetical protein